MTRNLTEPPKGAKRRLKNLRQDLTVFGTTGLEKTVEDFATRQRDALKQLDQLNARLTKIEQHLGIQP